MTAGAVTRPRARLLAAKGAAAPSGASRENLGPNSVERVLAEAAGPARRGTARVNVSVRLDRDRHRRLKRASADLGIPAQSVLILALDSYLNRVERRPAAIGGPVAPDKRMRRADRGKARDG